VELHHRVKFRGDQSNCCQYMAIFFNFKMAATTILDFSICENLMVVRVKRDELRHHAKFRSDRFNCWGDMAIFQFFQDGGRPPSWICYAHVWTTHEGSW